MHFVEGAQWDEAHAGTNAPGVALATSKAARIAAAEHFQKAVQRWSCSAVPVYSPTGQPLGVIDVTGDERAAQPTMLALVQATVAAVEAELRLRSAARPGQLPPRRSTLPRLQLEVLGRDEATSDDRPATRSPLSPRHGELLLILAAEPQGLSADEIAVRLDERPLDPVTVRAELSRLRRIVGARSDPVTSVPAGRQDHHRRRTRYASCSTGALTGRRCTPTQVRSSRARRLRRSCGCARIARRGPRRAASPSRPRAAGGWTESPGRTRRPRRLAAAPRAACPRAPDVVSARRCTPDCSMRQLAPDPLTCAATWLQRSRT